MDYARHIGTPLTPNATKVLLLGGGELGKGLATAFQKLGLEVHVVDRYEGAPAAQIAQYSYLADVTDAQAIGKLAERIQPHFVVPEVEMVAVEALAALESLTDAVVVPTARACELTQDRASMRAVSESLGLPTTAYRFASSPQQLREAVEELGVPCLVKPDIAKSGKGHVLVKDLEDVDEAWATVNRNAPDEGHQVVVERFVNFDSEITLLAVRSIDPSTGKLATWFSEPIGHRHERGDLEECWQPMDISQRALENARSMAARISNELGGRGVYGVSMFVAGDDVYFSSVSPRPCDTALVTTYTQRFSEFDLHARAILGYPIDVTLVTPGAATIIHADRDSEEVSYSGVGEAMAVAETDVQLFGKPGAYPRRRMGFVAATAETVAEARDRATIAARRLTVGPAADAGSGGLPDLDYVDEVDTPVVAVDPQLAAGVDDEPAPADARDARSARGPSAGDRR